MITFFYLILPFILSAEECTFQSNLISYDTDVSMDDIKDPIRPTFIRLVSPGCPYSPASQAQWEKAASLYPQVNFVTINSWENQKISSLFGDSIITPKHGLFKANSNVLIDDSVIGNSEKIHNSPQLFLDKISKHTNLYQIAPPLVSLSPMIIDSFYTAIDDPIILLYNSRCTDQVPFLNEWARVSNEVIYSNGVNPRIGMLDCSLYPEECQRWSHPYAYSTPRALIYSSKTCNYEVLDTYNTITSSKIDGLYANVISKEPKATPSPVPIPSQEFAVPSTDGYTVLENTELKNQKTIDQVRTEYQAAYVKPTSACKEPNNCNSRTLNAPSECPLIEPSEEDQTKALKMINFFRKLAGVTSNIVKDNIWSEQCYQTAINMHKIGKVPSNHIINDKYATSAYCGKTENIQVGKDSLLSENAQTVFHSSYQLIKDEGAHNNLVVGHRRYLLHTSLTKVGVGFYPYKEEEFNGFYMMRPAVTVIKVREAGSELNYLNYNVPDNLKFVSWPPEGPFPIEQLPSNWHISHKDFHTAKLEDLKVYVSRDDGAELKVKQISIPNDNVDDSLVIQMTDEALKRCQLMRIITVTVFNEPLKKVYRFSFELFDGKKVTEVCLYSNDASKCPDTVSQENKLGSGNYQASVFSSSDNLVKVHVVEPIVLDDNTKISLSALTRIFFTGETIDGKVEIGAQTTVDVQNPSKTSYQIIWNVGNRKIGRLETAIAAKSIHIDVQNENEGISIYDVTFYTGRQTSFGLAKVIYTGENNDIFYTIGGINNNFYVMASASPAYQEFTCSNDDEAANLGTPINGISDMIYQTTNKRVVKIYVSGIDEDNRININSFIPGRKLDYQFIVTGGQILFECDMKIAKVANSIIFKRYRTEYDSTKYNFEIRYPKDLTDTRYVCPMDFVTIIDAKFSGSSQSVVIMPYVKGDQNAINYYDPSDFNDIYPKKGSEDSAVITAVPTGSAKTRCIINTPGKYDSYTINYKNNYNPVIFRAAPGTEQNPVTLSLYYEDIQQPQSPTSLLIYFENYQDLTLNMATVKKWSSSIQSYLRVYHFDNCGKVTFIGNDKTTPKEPFEIPENLELGNFNFGCVLISPTVTVSGSDSYDASWYHAKHLSVSANSKPTITNITIKEKITVESATVILQKSTLEDEIEVNLKKTESWWPSISLRETKFQPKSVSIDLGITAAASSFLEDSEEYESHSLLTGIGSGLNCESIRSKTTFANIGKFALECSSDGTELVAIKGKENAPVLSPEVEKPTGGEPEQPTDNPIITPGPDGFTESSLNESLTQKFEEMEEATGDANQIVEITGESNIPFNTELKDNQFIKPPQDSTVQFNGGKLNLVIPEKVTVELPKKDESKLTIKGSGSVTLSFKESEGKQESIKLNSKSQINGPVTIIVPDEVTTFTIDTLELDSKSTIAVKKNANTENPVKINVREVTTLKNSEASLNNLKIQNTLKIAQSSVLNVDNVDIKDASISYNIDDYSSFDKEKPFFKGSFKTLPGSFYLTDSKDAVNKPSEKVEYTIVSGTFEDIKCEDWYPKIFLDKSGFNSKVCKDIQESKALDSENKKIVVQYDPSLSKGGKLGPGPIAGIVIGVVVVIAIIVVVIVVVVKRKKRYVNSTNDEPAGNDEV